MLQSPPASANAAHVIARSAGPIGVIEFSRPDKFNAMSRAMIDAIGLAIDRFEDAASGIRVVLFRAQGKNFCTGGDLDEARVMMNDPVALEEFLVSVEAVLRRLEESRLPIVAASQGLALAGGLEILLCCDVVLAASNARFGDQHVQYGLVPAWGGTQRLPRVFGLHRALNLMFSGEWIDAPTAADWGLVAKIVAPEDLEDAAMDYCMALASRSRPGLAAMKHLARGAFQNSFEEGLALERATVAAGMLGNDPAEGIAAFEARRAPRFGD